MALSFTLLIVATGAAQQQPAQAPDPELKQIENVTKEAWQEAERYVKEGGKETDVKYPGRNSAALLWRYREQHPGTAASARATADALNFLVHAGQTGEVINKADSLPLD